MEIMYLIYIGALLTFIFWIISFIDILRNDFEGGSGTKIVWLFVVFFFYPLGAVLYQLIGRSQKIDKYTEDMLAS